MPEPIATLFAVTLAVAGKFAGAFFGAIVSLRFIPGLTTTGKVVYLLGGIATAHYLGAPLAAMVNVPSGSADFVVGMFGMSAADAFTKAVRSTDWQAIIKQRLGG